MIQYKYTNSKTQSPSQGQNHQVTLPFLDLPHLPPGSQWWIHLWCTVITLTNGGCALYERNLLSVVVRKKKRAIFLRALCKSTRNNFPNTEVCDKKGQTHRCLLCCWQCDPKTPKTLKWQTLISTWKPMSSLNSRVLGLNQENVMAISDIA